MSLVVHPVPTDLEFVAGRIYRRRELHDQYGGSYQSGISASRRAPVIFIFTTETGVAEDLHGYHDSWVTDDTFHYSGEGQKGDMTFTKGNLAIRAHHDDGRSIHLFERPQGQKGVVRYIGQMEYIDHRMVDGARDGVGNPRRAIQFVLRRVDAVAPPDNLIPFDDYFRQFPPPTAIEMELTRMAASRMVADGRAEYDASPGTNAPTIRSSVLSIRTLVLRRAGNHCEGCGAPAPFLRADGSPYLEAHDTQRLSDHEFSSPAEVIALCPNCHRRVHHGEDGPVYDEELREKLAEITSRR